MKGILYGFIAVCVLVAFSLSAYADHSHRCNSCGTIWSHGDNDPSASHNCPRCGLVQTTQYSGGARGAYAGPQGGTYTGPQPVRGFFRWAFGPRRPRVQNNVQSYQHNYYGVHPPATIVHAPAIPTYGCAGSVPTQGWYQSYGQPVVE